MVGYNFDQVEVPDIKPWGPACEDSCLEEVQYDHPAVPKAETQLLCKLLVLSGRSRSHTSIADYA